MDNIRKGLDKTREFLAYPTFYTSTEKKIAVFDKNKKIGAIVTFVALSTITGGGYLLGHGAARLIKEIAYKFSKENPDKNKFTTKIIAGKIARDEEPMTQEKIQIQNNIRTINKIDTFDKFCSISDRKELANLIKNNGELSATIKDKIIHKLSMNKSKHYKSRVEKELNNMLKGKDQPMQLAKIINKLDLANMIKEELVKQIAGENNTPSSNLLTAGIFADERQQALYDAIDDFDKQTNTYRTYDQIFDLTKPKAHETLISDYLEIRDKITDETGRNTYDIVFFEKIKNLTMVKVRDEIERQVETINEKITNQKDKIPFISGTHYDTGEIIIDEINRKLSQMGENEISSKNLLRQFYTEFLNIEDLEKKNKLETVINNVISFNSGDNRIQFMNLFVEANKVKNISVELPTDSPATVNDQTLLKDYLSSIYQNTIKNFPGTQVNIYFSEEGLRVHSELDAVKGDPNDLLEIKFDEKNSKYYVEAPHCTDYKINEQKLDNYATKDQQKENENPDEQNRIYFKSGSNTIYFNDQPLFNITL